MVDRPSLSLNLRQARADPHQRDRALKVMVRPDINTTWTERAVQNLLAVLLHEVTHVIVLIFAFNCVDCESDDCVPSVQTSSWCLRPA